MTRFQVRRNPGVSCTITEKSLRGVIFEWKILFQQSWISRHNLFQSAALCIGAHGGKEIDPKQRYRFVVLFRRARARRKFPQSVAHLSGSLVRCLRLAQIGPGDVQVCGMAEIFVRDFTTLYCTGKFHVSHGASELGLVDRGRFASARDVVPPTSNPLCALRRFPPRSKPNIDNSPQPWFFRARRARQQS
jgi:hypothetical protein